MSRNGPLRWLLPLLRYGLLVAAIVYLVNKVTWYDYVRLNDASLTRVRLLEEHSDTVVVLRNGQRETLPLSQVHYVADGKLPDIEPGLASVVRDTDMRLALIAVLLCLPAPLLMSLRLVWMLAIQDVRIGLWDSVKLTFAGNFFNYALPGTTGGDLIKAYYITRFTHQKTEAVTTVFLDRVIGLFGLVIVAGAMMLVSWDPKHFGHLATGMAVVCGGLAVFALIVFSKRLRHAIRLPQIAARLPAGEHLLRIGRATVAMRHHKGLVIASLVNTVVLQAFVMFAAYIMALALGMQNDFARYFVYVPVGFLIAAIPISPPQAFGVMEWAYVQFFAQTGMSTVTQAAAFALAVRVMQLVWALPGVLVPLLGAHLPKAADLEALERAESKRELA